MWAHSSPERDGIYFGGRDLTYLIYPNPFVAVMIFYFLSAYGIGRGFASGKYVCTPGSLAGFFRRRVLRIVPLYLVCVFASWLLVFRDRQVPFAALVPFLTFTANDSAKLPFLAPLAIISTEMQFYLVAPVLFLLLRHALKKFSAISVVSAVLLAGVAARYMSVMQGAISSGTSYNAMIYTTVWGNIDIFLSGMLVSMVVPVIRLSSAMRRLLAVLFMVSAGTFYVFSAAMYYLFDFSRDKYQYAYIVPGAVSLLLGCFVVLTRNLRLPQALGKPVGVLSGLSTLTYGVYVWHVPVATAFFPVFFPGWDAMLHRYRMTVMLSLILSAGTYLTVEKPFLLLSRRFRGRLPQPGTSEARS